jgi:thiamine-phosphate pyrophosphorylase
VEPDLSLCLVIGSRPSRGRPMIETVRAALRGGVTTVQLRDKEASGRDLTALAEALLDLVAGTPVTVLVNDRVDVALAAGAHGVHLGQSDVDALSARRIAGPSFAVGLSVSRAADVARVSGLPAGTVDYLGIGPVFPTTTKPDAEPALGLAGVAALRAATHLPCVAIGGITQENARAVRATGVDGVAVVSAICATDRPEVAAAALRTALL